MHFMTMIHPTPDNVGCSFAAAETVGSFAHSFSPRILLSETCGLSTWSYVLMHAYAIYVYMSVLIVDANQVTQQNRGAFCPSFQVRLLCTSMVLVTALWFWALTSSDQLRKASAKRTVTQSMRMEDGEWTAEGCGEFIQSRFSRFFRPYRAAHRRYSTGILSVANSNHRQLQPITLAEAHKLFTMEILEIFARTDCRDCLVRCTKRGLVMMMCTCILLIPVEQQVRGNNPQSLRNEHQSHRTFEL